MSVDWSTVGAVGAPILLFVGTVLGLLFKRSVDRQAARDLAEKDKADRAAAAEKDKADREAAERKAQSDREAKRAQEVYDQMQEDLAAARTEVRALQTDLGLARSELGKIWQQMATMRRELEAAETHISDIHRWDDGGRKGPIPTRALP